MDDPKTEHEEAERGILSVDPTRRRQLVAILEFLRDIHHHIDPDQYDIDVKQVHAMLRSLSGEHHGDARVGVTYGDLFFLEIAVEAADTYSHRSFHAPIEGVEDEDFTDLLEWLTRETNALFRRPPTLH